MYEIVKQEEERVYRLFNVASIEELNERVQVKMQPLLNFNNDLLQKRLQLIEERVGVGHYLNAFQTLFTRTFNEKRIEQQMASDEELLADTRLAIINQVNAVLTSNQVHFQATKKDRSLGGLLSNFIVRNGVIMLNDTINNSKFRPDVKNRLDEWLRRQTEGNQGTDLKTDYNDISASTTFLVTEKNRQAYAGWSYSYSAIKSDPALVNELRTRIYEQCCDIIGPTNTECIAAFTHAFARFPDVALFQKTITDVMGALGEIQLGAIVEMLLDGQDAAQLQTGNLQNALKSTGEVSSFGHQRKLAIDFVLEGVGFQVKNYNAYANLLGLDILKGHKALVLGKSGTVNKVNSDLSLNSELDNIIQLFFGIKSFNIKYENPDEEMASTVDNYDPVVHMIDSIDNEVRNLYGLFPDRLLRLSQDLEVFNQGESILKGRYFKTFYFSNGVFIPASKLLHAIILLFDDLRKGNLQEFVLQSSYTGPVAEAFQDIPDNTPTYRSIAAQTHLRLNYVFLLDNYLRKAT